MQDLTGTIHQVFTNVLTVSQAFTETTHEHFLLHHEAHSVSSIPLLNAHLGGNCHLHAQRVSGSKLLTTKLLKLGRFLITWKVTVPRWKKKSVLVILMNHSECADSDVIRLLSLLQNVPTLEELELHKIYLHDDFFALLALLQSRDPNLGGDYVQTPAVLPRLQTLHLSIPYGPLAFSWSAVQQALSKRAAHAHTEDGRPLLDRVDIKVSVKDNEEGYYINEAGVAIFEGLIDEGVEIKIRNSSRTEAHSMLANSKAHHEERMRELGSDV
ncbi:unnamed protein product [Cyclocybe aegerita]|uniref:Uncharacterized protein n=1 Tax=Cyclocybe aegerita TaxID=1973307 RepID=A0A8S0W766_CYCAE|nr:unnamed protein product [Cyclocybe aegerita]